MSMRGSSGSGSPRPRSTSSRSFSSVCGANQQRQHKVRDHIRIFHPQHAHIFEMEPYLFLLGQELLPLDIGLLC